MTLLESDYLVVPYDFAFGKDNVECQFCKTHLKDNADITLEVIAREMVSEPDPPYEFASHTLHITKIQCHTCGAKYAIPCEKTIAEQLEQFKDHNYRLYVGETPATFKNRIPVGWLSHAYVVVCLHNKYKIEYTFSCCLPPGMSEDDLVDGS